MGTGAVALALNQFPFPVPGLHDIAGGLRLLDIVLFACFTGLYGACWTASFDEAGCIFQNSVLLMFLGTIPMGLATIINGIIAFSTGEAGNGIAYGLWWVDVIMSVACGLVVPFLMFTCQHHSIQTMTAAWLLPPSWRPKCPPSAAPSSSHISRTRMRCWSSFSAMLFGRFPCRSR